MESHQVISEKERKTIEEKAWSKAADYRTSSAGWGVVADCWMKWVRRDSPSWDYFVSWLIENNIDPGAPWDFLSKYGNSTQCFSEEWIAPEERDEFLAFCGADTVTAEAMD
ncbi:MAG: hypothetical protein K8I29_20070 [Alphaproteobacteria bacterium]|uniref:Uncharacterized protein n=1 Tax=Candidatus Nitrobium versatile TaxID=2884831 RepID=A0A953M3V1_9BACT|nr:hypothetical protein [Candidatus Nitrobium versatile]